MVGCESCVLLAVQNPYQEGEKLLYSFASQEDLKRWTVFSDQEYGGKSTAELALSDSEPVSLSSPRMLTRSAMKSSNSPDAHPSTISLCTSVH